MRAAKNIVGYIVLDEGRPVRRCNTTDPEHRYYNYPSPNPVALFALKKTARRVKDALRRRYCGIAHSVNPQLNEDTARVHSIWLERAKGLRISAVRTESPANAQFTHRKEGR